MKKKISELQNKLIKKKCSIFYDKNIKTHVSSHPSKELKKCMIGYHRLIIPNGAEFTSEQANFAKKNVG